MDYQWIKCWCRAGAAELTFAAPDEPAGWIEQEVLAAIVDGAPMPAGAYQERRRTAYPPLSDQLDALWKLLDALTAGTTPPADAVAVQGAVATVKTAIPKPPDGPWVR